MAKDINVSITAGKEEEGLFYDLVTVKEKLDNLPHIPGEDDDVTFKSVTVKEDITAPNGTVSGQDIINTSEDYPNFETDQCVTKGWVDWYFGENDFAHLGGDNTFTGLNEFTENVWLHDTWIDKMLVSGDATLNGDVSIHKATLDHNQVISSLESNDFVTKGTTDSLISRLSVDYDSEEKMLELKYDGNVISRQDARPFIKDGMVDRVYLDGIGNLVISFNTDAGKESISIPLDQIFNPNNYYTKTDVDNIVDGIYGEGPCDDYDTLTKCQAGFEDVYAHKTDFQDGSSTSTRTYVSDISNGVGAKAFTNVFRDSSHIVPICGMTFEAINGDNVGSNQFISSNRDASDVWCRTYNPNSSAAWRRIKASLGNIYTGEDISISDKYVRFVHTAQEFIDALDDANVTTIYIAAEKIDCGTTELRMNHTKCIIGMSIGFYGGMPSLTACIRYFAGTIDMSLVFINLRYSPNMNSTTGSPRVYLFDCIEESSHINLHSLGHAYHYNCLIEGNSDYLLSGGTQQQSLYDCTVINNSKTGLICSSNEQIALDSRGNTFMLPNQNNNRLEGSTSFGPYSMLGKIIEEYPKNRCTEGDLLKRDNTLIFADGRRESPKGITLSQGVLIGGYGKSLEGGGYKSYEYYHQVGKMFYIGNKGSELFNPPTSLPSITEGSENDCPLLFRMMEPRHIALETAIDSLNLTIEGPALHRNSGQMEDINDLSIVNRKMDEGDDEYTLGEVNLKLVNLEVKGMVQFVAGRSGSVSIRNCHFKGGSFPLACYYFAMNVDFYNCVIEVIGDIPFRIDKSYDEESVANLKFVNCTIVGSPHPFFGEGVTVSNSHGNTFISCMPEGSLVFATQDEQDKFIKTNTLKYLG